MDENKLFYPGKPRPGQSGVFTITREISTRRKDAKGNKVLKIQTQFLN